MRVSTFFMAVLLAATPVAGQLWNQRAALYVEDELALTGPASNDEFAFALVAGDFDGDGADDLATGIPFDDNAGALHPNSGIVVVRFGVAGEGLAGGIAGQVLSQIFGGSPDPAEASDLFGRALAAGDFDGDGFDDVAVGVPGESIDEGPEEGAVQVYYGSAGGLDLEGVQLLTEDSPGVPGETSSQDRFGWALAASDFDGDGRDDLAVGVPFEGDFCFPTCTNDYGSVNVFYGSAGGLTTSGSQRFTQETPGIPGADEEDDEFGTALATCDFDGDGYGDLAVGVPGENAEAGSVRVLYGGSAGLDPTGAQSFDQGADGVPESAEPGDLFGRSLACGDFDGDTRADLAIGAHREDLGAAVDAGVVVVLVGGASGLTAIGSQLWSQDTDGVPDLAESADHLGITLAVGDFAREGADDLAIGARGEDVGNGPFDGAVLVLAGSAPSGLLAVGAQLWAQSAVGVPGDGEQGDEFGRALAVGDFDGTGYDDLVVGAPRESIEGLAGSGHGAEWVLYGQLFGHGFEGGGTAGWSATVP